MCIIRYVYLFYFLMISKIVHLILYFAIFASNNRNEIIISFRMICDVCSYIHQNRMLHVLRTHEKWQQCLASNQSKINRSQETKTNIISFSHSLRMHVSLYVRIRKGRVIHLRHFNVRMDYRISIGNSTMVPIHHRYHKFVTCYCKWLLWMYWVFSITNTH